MGYSPWSCTQSDTTEHTHIIGTEDFKQKRNVVHVAVLEQLYSAVHFFQVPLCVSHSAVFDPL